jgi:hypothetical protein
LAGGGAPRRDGGQAVRGARAGLEPGARHAGLAGLPHHGGAALLYLVFLIPFGAFATPALQSVTARLIDLLLDPTGIPHYVDDLIIETPAGVFFVAEACAGCAS